MARLLFVFFFLVKESICIGQLLDSLLRTDSSWVVKTVLADPERYRIQICFTQITETKTKSKGLVKLQNFLGVTTRQNMLKHHYFRASSSEYFFPASLVKFPVAAFALEYLHQLNVYGVSTKTPFAPLNDFQCKGNKNKPTKPYPQSTYELIHKIFVYSDNAAYNYLYELCGQHYLNKRLADMGYDQARITEKIANCGGEANRQTGPIAFFNGGELFHMEGRQMTEALPSPSINAKIGKGYIWNGKYIPAPKDFSSTNFLPLQDLHQMLISLYMPAFVDKEKRFKLTGEDHLLLSKAMATLPSTYCPDSCDGRSFPDNHMKYLFGENDTLLKSLRISNKVGLAHGFISDCSFLEDSENDLRFFLSAVLYVNKDGILNDGKYEYQTVGLPFLRRLGSILYAYELKQRTSRVVDK